MSFVEIGGNRVTTPEHNRLRGLDVGDPHPQYSPFAHSHVLGYAIVDTQQSGITTEADLTDMTVTVNLAAGRLIRVSLQAAVYSSIAGDYWRLAIKESTTTLQTVFGYEPGAGSQQSESGSVLLTPSAGPHTYNVSLERSAGTGSLTHYANSTNPSHLLVEDIGEA